jgi:tetratricopeptide (TPR) repeat protein
MHRVISWAAALLSVFAAAVASAAADDLGSCNKIGDDTIAACSRLIQRNANDWGAYSNRGVAYNGKGQYDRAIADFSQAIRLKPVAMLYVARGSVYSLKGDHDQALADYDQALRLDPNLAAVYGARAVTFYKKGDYGRAVVDASEAIRLNPKSADNYIGRALAYGGMGEHGRAIADYDQAMSLSPGNASLYLARGVSWWKQGNPDRAIADYDQAIRLASTLPGPYGNRCAAYNDRGDYDRAIADCDRAIQIDPNVANAYSHRGYAYGRKGSFDLAMADLNKGVALDPQYARGYSNRAAIYELRGDAARAIADSDAALRLDPRDAFAYNWRGKAYADQGQHVRAIADYDQAIRLSPLLGDARLNRERSQAALMSAVSSGPVAGPQAGAQLAPGPQTAAASAAGPASAAVAATERRAALVVGNSAYRSVAALPNPKRDAQTVADALRQSGFQSVELALDLDRDGMVKALRSFRDQADRADWALVYYAGHGIEINRVNYLIPIDAKLTDDRDVKTETVSYDDLMTAVGGARALRLIVLDACRNNPFKESMRATVASRGSLSRGLAPPPEAEPGTLVVYSAKEGEVAADDVDGSNSPFARAFVAGLKVPGREVRRLFDLIRDDVMDATNRRQQPYTYGSLSGRRDFYFVAGK